MNIEEIKTFLYVAKYKNFSRTAETLYCSQSTVTARIKALETELNCKLFLRTNSNVELTEQGKLYLHYAKGIYNLEKEGKQTLMMSQQYSDYITLGAPDSVWQYPLSPYLKILREKHPDTALNLISHHSQEIFIDILESVIDFGISLTKPRHRHLKGTPLWKSRHVLVGSPDLILPDTIFSPDTAKQFPFIHMAWEPGFLNWLELTYHPRIYPYHTDRFYLFLHLLKSGLGIGFLPMRIASTFLESGEFIEIPYAFSEQAPQETGYLIQSVTSPKNLDPYIDLLFKIVIP